jgi:predicted Zn-dependent protease
VRDLALAETLARKAVASLPLEPRFLDTLSETLFRQGKRQEARTIIERALQNAGDDPELTSYLQEQKTRFQSTSGTEEERR